MAVRSWNSRKCPGDVIQRLAVADQRRAFCARRHGPGARPAPNAEEVSSDIALIVIRLIVVIIIVMGVTGSGKTTVGERLAADLGWRFHDADDFHSPANKAKMHAGLPLTDEDRWPWLDAIHSALERDVADHVSAVVACSALREVYRQRLEAGLPDVGLVLLDGDPAILVRRLSHRTDHFMNPALLGSQIDTLERPSHAVIVDIAKPVGVQVSLIREAFGI